MRFEEKTVESVDGKVYKAFIMAEEKRCNGVKMRDEVSVFGANSLTVLPRATSTAKLTLASSLLTYIVCCAADTSWLVSRHR